MEKTGREPLLPASIIHNRIFNGVWDSVLMLAAFFVVVYRWEVVGSLVFLGLIGIMLILSDRLIDCWVPLILMTVILTRCYDSYDVFIKFAPFIGAVIAAVLFHVIYYWQKPQLGASFPGLCAVAAAVTFGGAFFIPAADYFRSIMLYYVGCLGVLMPLLYAVAKPRVNDAARERFLRGLFFAGCLAAVAVVTFYVRDWNTFKYTHRMLRFQPSNNLATFLMMSLPAAFFFSKKSRWLIAVPTVMYVAVLFSASRGGIFLGTAEFLLLLVFFCCYRSDWFRRIVFLLHIIAVVLIFIVFLPKVLTFYNIDLTIAGFSNMKTSELLQTLFVKLFNHDEGRLELLSRAWTDFRANPLFGVGLGYRGNSDLYNPVRGAMNWYHMWVPQIVGGLGIVGVLCYGYQLFLRIRLAFSRRAFAEVTLSLCYFGLFLMSQVNPGEFCPFPYAVTATLIFTLIEPNTPSSAKTQTVNDKPAWLDTTGIHDASAGEEAFMNTASVLFDVIKSELESATFDDSIFGTLSSEQIIQLYQLAKSHDLAHYIGKVWHGQKGDAFENVREKFEKEYHLSLARYAWLTTELEKLCVLLEQNQTPFILLKGSVLRSYYANPHMRTSCDIDVLIHEQDIDKIRNVLTKEGYSAEPQSSHDISFFSANNTHIELHYILIEENRIKEADQPLKNIWSYAALKAGGAYQYVLSDDMFYYYHIAHMAKHFLVGGCGIRPFIDLYILEHKVAHDQQKREALLKQGGLLTFAEQAQRLSEVWFGNAEHTEITRNMEQYVLKGGVFGTVSNRAAMGQAKEGGKMRYLLSRIWLPYSIMKQGNPKLAKHKWLLPFYEIRRWFKAVFRKGIKKSAVEMKTSTNVTKDRQRAAKKLLMDLDLQK